MAKDLPSPADPRSLCYDLPHVRILIDYRPALRQRTGVGEYARGLSDALVEEMPAGSALTLFSSSWKDRLAEDTLPGATVVDRRVPVKLLNLAWHRAEWPPVEWLAGAPFDVVQSLHPLLIPARRGVRFVTIHDLDFLDRPDRTRAEIRRDYPALAAKHARRAAGVVVPSEYTRNQVCARLGVPGERIVHCPAGAPAWQPRAEPPDRGPILFVGTIERRKNVRGLVAAYERLLGAMPDAPPLVLAGRSGPDAPDLLKAGAAATARIDPRGYITEADRQDLYRTASMLVLPSFDEGFGLPVLEAMTIGLPVIVSARGSLPELAGEAGLMVGPDDHAGLAAAMRRVLEDAPLRRRMVEGGLQRARLYSWKASARRLLDAYRFACERGAPGS